MQLTPLTRQPAVSRSLAFGLLATVSVIVFLIMQPAELFSSTTPSGGDMGAHVLVPAYLRDNLLPSLRVSGWSNDWFAGFPILYFYFPLPALTIVALDVILPYGVAFKLVTIMGLLAMPFGSYYLARQMRAPRLVATMAGIAGGTFVLMESYAIYGGNIKSTLAGEYSFSWAMAFSLFYLGALMRDSRSGRRFSPLAAIMLAGMALSHIIPTAIVGAASLIFLAQPERRRAITTWALGFALAAFWVVPLVATIGFTTDMNFSPLRGFDAGTGGPLPTELWPLLPLAVIGLVWSLWQRYSVSVLVLTTLLPLLAYPFVSGKLWNGRLLPYWFFGVFFFAGLAVGLAALAVYRRLPARTSVLVGVGLAGAALLIFPPASGMEQSSGWARWNYSGYEDKGPYPEYENLMATVDTLPPGRIMWEANNDMDKYGTPMALMLFPYWSEGHPSMEGLLFESSLSTPFHFMNAAEMSDRPSNPIPGLPYSGFDLDKGLAHMELFNVRYYVTFTERATSAARLHPAYTEIAQASPWTIFQLPDSSLVDVAEYVPAVYEPSDEVGVLERAGLIFREDEELEDFFRGAVDWHSQVETLDHWMVESGPADWPRVSEGLGGLEETAAITTAGSVSNVVLEDDRISFETTAIGVPHLVKVSFFPNWKVTGADGPYRSAPAFMVVIPTESQVELTFARRWYESTGLLLTTLAALGLGVWLIRQRRLATPRSAPAGEPPVEPVVVGEPGETDLG
ncbi:MAG: hypothetical protein KJN73_00455 [Acidimicrobiia bacterium]|nr:hypothetical protein [Acidimicrobiia bacterium]NNJ48546.1 hypothetical protein [Acidimicrobiia bacterium]